MVSSLFSVLACVFVNGCYTHLLLNIDSSGCSINVSCIILDSRWRMKRIQEKSINRVCIELLYFGRSNAFLFISYFNYNFHLVVVLFVVMWPI